MTTIRVILPGHLQTLAGVEREVEVQVEGRRPTIADVLEQLERDHPVLRGTIREHGTGERRAYLRYFACQEDLSHVPPDTELPEPILRGEEAFRVLGAISGG